MPKDTLILGSSSYKPTDAEARRLQTFVKWLPTKVKPSSIVLVSPDAFPNVAKQLGGNDTLVAFSNGDRTYLNAAALNPSRDYLKTVIDNLRTPFAGQNPQEAYGDKITPQNLAEWVLAHETAHMNSKLRPQQQEDRDYLQSEAANDLIRQYNSPAGKAYQAAQAQVASDAGKVQPTEAPVQTDLVQPTQPVLDRTSQLMKLQSENRVANIMAQKPRQTYAQRVMSRKP